MHLLRNSSLGRIQSALSGEQPFSWHESEAVAQPTKKHHSQISNDSSIQRKPQGSANQQKQQDATRTSPEVLWCVSLYKVTTNNDQWRRQGEPMPQHHQWRPGQQSPRKISKEWQGKPIPHSVVKDQQPQRHNKDPPRVARWDEIFSTTNNPEELNSKFVRWFRFLSYSQLNIFQT